jgi:hypothetical protein
VYRHRHFQARVTKAFTPRSTRAGRRGHKHKRAQKVYKNDARLHKHLHVISLTRVHKYKHFWNSRTLETCVQTRVRNPKLQLRVHSREKTHVHPCANIFRNSSEYTCKQMFQIICGNRKYTRVKSHGRTKNKGKRG